MTGALRGPDGEGAEGGGGGVVLGHGGQGRVVLGGQELGVVSGGPLRHGGQHDVQVAGGGSALAARGAEVGCLPIAR